VPEHSSWKAEIILDIQMKYEILENCRYVLERREI
jgi:hypothetical protein